MSDWISVQDHGLPKQDGRYFVAEDHHTNWVGVCPMRNGKFDMKITHWMPLPDHPLSERK